MYNEKLGAGAVWHLGTGHGNRPSGVGKWIVYTVFGKFSFDGFLCPSGSIPVRITSLHHKPFHNTMKGKSVIKTVFCQFYKVFYGNRRMLRIQGYCNGSIILYLDFCHDFFFCSCICSLLLLSLGFLLLWVLFLSATAACQK